MKAQDWRRPRGRWLTFGSFLLVGVASGCRPLSKETTGPGGSTADTSEAPDSDSVGDIPDSGVGDTGLPAAPRLVDPCPTTPLSTMPGGSIPHLWYTGDIVVESDAGPEFWIDVELIAWPTEWKDTVMDIWDGARLSAASEDRWAARVAGSYKVGLTPEDVYGQRGDPVVCDIEVIHEQALFIEVLTNPNHIGDRDLHFLQQPGSLFSVTDDLTWCNEHYSGADPEDSDDDLSWTGFGRTTSAAESEFAVSVAPGPQVRDIVIHGWESSNLEDPEANLPYETEVRVHLQGVLVDVVRGRVQPGEAWLAGTVDVGANSFAANDGSTPNWTVPPPHACR